MTKILLKLGITQLLPPPPHPTPQSTVSSNVRFYQGVLVLDLKNMEALVKLKSDIVTITFNHKLLQCVTSYKTCINRNVLSPVRERLVY